MAAASFSYMALTEVSILGLTGWRKINLKKTRTLSVSAQQQEGTQVQEPEQQKVEEDQEGKKQKELRPVEVQRNVKSKSMGREYGGQWLSSTTRHIRIYAAYIDPVTFEFDQSQMDKLTLILDPGNEFEWNTETCNMVYSYFQELVDHYEGAPLTEYTLRLIGSDLEHYIGKLLYDGTIKYNMNCRVLNFSMGKPRIGFSYSEANFTTNSTYGQNRNQILSSLASNATANGGFYTTNFTQGFDDTIYALALCRGDLSNQSCYNCVDTASQSIIVNCPNKMEAFEFGASSHCIVRCSDQSFFSTMAYWPARLVWVAINITTNVDEFDNALSNLVVSLVNRVSTGSSVGKFATGEIAYTAFDKIYGLVQCVPDLSSADCISCISSASYYYRNEDCCFRKRAVSVITPSCIFQYDLSNFYESSAGAAPPPPAPPLVTFSPPPPSTNVTTKGEDESRTIQTTILIVVPVSILLLLTVTVLACGFFRLRKREDVKMTVDCSCLCNLAWIRAAGKLFRASSQHGAHYAGKYLKIEELIIFGYMPPEYAKFGRFSVKTDVFSFGVLILEIVSGKKYSGYGGPEHVEHLISYAWKKWRQGKASRLIDDTLVGGSESEKMRCIHIGLLCVQENVAKRPTMAAVVLMFNSFSMCLPSPSKPGFFVGSSTEPDTALGNRFPPVTSSHHSQEQSVNVSVNEASITDPADFESPLILLHADHENSKAEERGKKRALKSRTFVPRNQLVMGASDLIFLISCILLNLLLNLPLNAAQICSNSGNFTSNSTYGKNRNQILSSLPSNVTTNDGFFTASLTQDSETVYVLALCRGDVSNDSCFDCVNYTSRAILMNCPNQKEATNYGDYASKCIVRCSNVSFFDIMETQPPRYIYITSDITYSVDEFDQALNSLVESLITRTAMGSSTIKFATGEGKFGGYLKIYVLMQCIPGIASVDCSRCLRGAVDEYRSCCFRKRGANVLRPSCMFLYDLIPFFESSAGAAPPPPPPSLLLTFAPSPSTNVTTKEGAGSKSSKFQTAIIIVVLVSILLVFVGLACACFLSRKREIVQERLDSGHPFNSAWRRAAGKLFSGYMPPEYAKFGRFSVKTDVFSFGVLILEIVSGKKYNGCGGPEHVEHLISYAWKKWRQGKASRLIDETLVDGSKSEKMRCIHIGLLCVQENVAKRPTMAAVVLMLNDFSTSLPLPSKPGFFVGSSMEPDTALGNRFPPVTSSHHSQDQPVNVSVNEASITDPYPR
ncbi:hypothetical protein RHSIM_Rhsim02G0113900 [Rhododendron simsii]|uniref:Gnk2-homologous domain-containing protein n=1 Tax=Rhododendron simsii TaxID=118357 RepID=A0A834HCN5_RHOSS|nr:hypothetical protein RHSIM_Rhsim02G0113900 [Rhododendron simsii]